MTIEEIQNEIVSEFAIFDEWMDKYAFLIDLGNDLGAMDKGTKSEENLIRGCQSQVWVHADLINDKVVFQADSDAIITKGIIGLLIKVFSNQSPKDIMDADLFFIESIGLQQNLSPTRSNGLLSMIKQMKLYAIAYNEKLKK